MFRSMKLATVPLLLLTLLHLVAIFAGFFAPYSYREQNRQSPRAAPARIGFVGANGSWGLRPMVETGQGPVPLRFLVRGSSYSFLGLFDTDWHLFGVDPPHRAFLLGTDALGRDYLSRLLYGGQVSLTAGLLAATIALSLALSLGAIAGYRGGMTDDLIMRASDVFLSLPWLYMLLAARAFLPLDLDPASAFLVIVMLLGLLGWAAPTRVLRGIVLSATQRDYVQAARSAGAGHAHLLRHHVLPQTYGVLLVQAALLVPAYMLAEVTLSFVGLGVGEPRPSWGNMLANLSRTSLLAARWWMFSPALVLVAVTWLYQSVLSSLRHVGLRSLELGSSE